MSTLPDKREEEYEMKEHNARWVSTHKLLTDMDMIDPPFL